MSRSIWIRSGAGLALLCAIGLGTVLLDPVPSAAQGTTAEAATASSFRFPIPADQYVVPSFGQFSHETIRPNHIGEDIPLGEGTPIRAIASGRIVQYEFHCGYAGPEDAGECQRNRSHWDDGISIAAVIEHELPEPVTLELTIGDTKTVTVEKMTSIYGHIRNRLAYDDPATALPLKPGDRVTKGQIIGYVNGDEHNGIGGEHLHLGVRLEGHQGEWRYWGFESTAIPLSSAQFFAAPSEVIPELSPEQGMAAAHVRWHPDGLLVKAADRPDVYLLSGGARQQIAGPSLINSYAYGFEWPGIVEVSTAELECYPQGPTVSASPRLIQASSPHVYLLVNEDTRRRMGSPDILRALGFSFNDVADVSPSELRQYEMDLLQPAAESPYWDGELIRGVGSSDVFLISNGTRRLIQDEAVFSDLGFNFKRVVVDNPDFVRSIPRGLPIQPRDLETCLADVEPPNTVSADDAEVTVSTTAITTRVGQDVASVFNANNTGSTTWTDSGGYVFARFAADHPLGTPDQLQLDAGEHVATGVTRTWTIDFDPLVGPGVYWQTWQMRNVRRGEWFGQQATIAITVLPPEVAVSPTSGVSGSAFEVEGIGFAPDSTATSHLRKPDGSEFPTLTLETNTTGSYTHTVDSSSFAPGTYTHWAVDDATGAVSNEVTFEVLPQLISLSSPGSVIYPADTAFSVRHGWGLPSCDLLDDPGTRFTLLVDGVAVAGELDAQCNDDGTAGKRFLYAFPDGLQGLHLLRGEWWLQGRLFNFNERWVYFGGLSGAGAQITGTARDAETGEGLAGIFVTVWDATASDQLPEALAAETLTDQSGLYAVSVPSGLYWVEFFDGGLGYGQTWSPDAAGPPEPAPIVADAGEFRADGLMRRAGAVTGMVTDEITGAPIADVPVGATPLGLPQAYQHWTIFRFFQTHGFTDAEGRYRLEGLRPGDYRVQFFPGFSRYEGEFWDDQTSWTEADPVVVEARCTTSGVDAALRAAPPLSPPVSPPISPPLSPPISAPVSPPISGPVSPPEPSPCPTAVATSSASLLGTPTALLIESALAITLLIALVAGLQAAESVRSGIRPMGAAPSQAT